MAERVEYKAAGGVVVDGERMLLLDRPSRGEIRLPKGHIEPGEPAKAAALRETTEESGYADLEVVADLGEQVVEFDYRGNHIVRRERYFLMRKRSDRQAVRTPKDAAQFTPRWERFVDVLALLTFPAEQVMAQRAIDAMQHQKQH